jgi:acetyl-CoA decarbonylase/synthase complex subunit gamma
MKITGLTLFKLLPGGKKEGKSNCKECGFPTCMAFAMKLAKGEVALSKCPYTSEEIKNLLETQGGKTQHEITFGIKEFPLKTGGENVLFRHDKTFINQPPLSIKVKTSQGLDKCLQIVERSIEYKVDRVGNDISVDSITIEDDCSTPETFQNLIQASIDKGYTSRIAFILISNNLNELSDAAKKISEYQIPLLYLKKADIEDLKCLYQQTQCPIVVTDESSPLLAARIDQLEKTGISKIVIALSSSKADNIVETLTLIRRSVVIDNFNPFKYPVMTFASDYCITDDCIEEGLWAGNLICKYSNLVVLDHFNPAILLSLFTLRQNIYTDPQKPLQIESNLYTIGDVDENSPVIVTTNFALTYFSVAGEIEASGIPCYLLITNSEGMSVLTAWAANKFNGEIIAKAVKEYNLTPKISHKNLIISGYVEILKEEIEEELPGWNVLIAPKEAVDIPVYLNELTKAKI